MNTYFDTSALLKLVLIEEGSDTANAAWDSSDHAITSRISYPESRAALAAAHRARRLSEGKLLKAKRDLERLFREFDLLDVSSAIARSAGELAEQLELRGYDAVHLASAISLDREDLVLATWDRAVSRAGRSVGVDLVGIKL